MATGPHLDSYRLHFGNSLPTVQVPITDYYARYLACELIRRLPPDSGDRLAGAVAGAQVCYSTEPDFIYVTTARLTQAQLQQLNDEVGRERVLRNLVGERSAREMARRECGNPSIDR